ncbi:hypothetical protein DUI87_10155 [Hirundo rustica rustica]|uniref:Uncharacterized protein n=1 Tax=Hirundo rustica rustica TaxID=333673 RepID=A0A3M0KJ15_HIRRU|nr:hypothetical protein DUI87_10155 [Hirundo rustica rustica]
MSKPGSAALQLRLGPAGQVHPNSAAHASSFAKPARFSPRLKAPPGPLGNSSAALPLRQKHQPPPLPGWGLIEQLSGHLASSQGQPHRKP